MENSVVNTQISTWVRKVFALQGSACINIFEENYEDNKCISCRKTTISIQVGRKKPVLYSILKPASRIIFDDIVYLKESMIKYLSGRNPVRSRIYRFFGWWIIFGGALTFFSVCPICGQAGCPVGVGTTGILAGVLALIKSNGKNFVSFVKKFFSKQNI